MRAHIVIVAVGVMGLAGITSIAHAAPKTDILIFVNGDRLTGEVKGLAHGKLQFNTDATNTIAIEWDKVASLESKQLLERRRDSRDKRRVTLGLTPRGRTLSQSSPYTIEHAVEQLLRGADAAAVTATKELLGALTELLERDTE